MIRRLKQYLCKHTFALDGMRETADSGPERITWPCSKCGKIFKAHCGLDITPKHGPLVKRRPLP